MKLDYELFLVLLMAASTIVALVCQVGGKQASTVRFGGFAWTVASLSWVGIAVIEAILGETRMVILDVVLAALAALNARNVFRRARKMIEVPVSEEKTAIK